MTVVANLSGNLPDAKIYFYFYRCPTSYKQETRGWGENKITYDVLSFDDKYDFKLIKEGAYYSPFQDNVCISILNFFGVKSKEDILKCHQIGLWRDEYVIAENIDCKVAFYGPYDYEGRFAPKLVFGKNNASFNRIKYNISKFTKKNKAICNAYHHNSDYLKRWYSPCTIDIFEGNLDDYLVLPLQSHLLFNLVPEVFNYNKNFLYLESPINKHTVQETREFFESIEPFSILRDYDVSPEERLKINQEKAEKLRKEKEYHEQLERQKEMDGYCDICGAPNAEYIEDPYEYDMNNSIVYRWMCPDCYEDACGDI